MYLYVTMFDCSDVLSVIQWGPPPVNLFSTTGCKRISQKVAFVIQEYGLRKKKQEL